MKEKKKRGSAYPLVILSLILLFNPNVGIIDVLPDAIAYFVLARVFLQAADKAPYFAEARDAFLKLGWLNLCRIPAFIIAATENTTNDTAVIASFVFSVAECILIIPAIRNLFEGLFRLGERTDAASLIRPFGKSGFTPELLQIFTYIFAVLKSVFAAVPDFFRLTRLDDNGYPLPISRWYSITLVAGVLLGLIIGVAWLTLSIKYVKAIHKEGQFDNAIDMIASFDSELRADKARKLHDIRSMLTLFTVATVFAFDIRFDNTGGINILPDLLFGMMLLIAVYKMRRFVPKRHMPYLYLSGGIYTAYSLFTFISETYFLYYYGYDELLYDTDASRLYTLTEALSVLEFAALTIFAVLIALSLRYFVLNHTGIHPSNTRYSRMDKDYHAALNRRVITLTVLMILLSLAKCVNIFSRGSVESVAVPGQPMVSILPALEWMGLIVSTLSIALFGFALYFFTLLKEEAEMKYREEW